MDRVNLSIIAVGIILLVIFSMEVYKTSAMYKSLDKGNYREFMWECLTQKESRVENCQAIWDFRKDNTVSEKPTE